MPKSNTPKNTEITNGCLNSCPPAGAAPADPEKIPPRPVAPHEIGACSERLNPVARLITALAAGFILLMALVIYASYLNRANYYLKAAHGAVEIWQGRFAPVGMERILILPGAQLPPAAKDVYSKNEIYAVAFNYYIDRADMLLEAPDMPDFNGIRLYLKTAMSYGVTNEMRRAAYTRLNNVDMMIYLYKADVAASKGTLADFKKALEYMAKAAALELDTAQSDLVNKKIQSIQELMADLQEKKLEPPEAPVSVPADRQPSQRSPESPAK